MMRSQFLICGIFLFSLCWTASAQEPARITWEHDNGRFTNTKTIFWREYVNDTKRVHHWVEIHRNRDFIELYDDSREFTFRLYPTKAMLKRGGEFEEFFTGRWKN